MVRREDPLGPASFLTASAARPELLRTDIANMVSNKKAMHVYHSYEVNGKEKLVKSDLSTFMEVGE